MMPMGLRPRPSAGKLRYNHLPSILRNILESINKRLSEISSDKDYFDKAKGVYEDALIIKVDTKANL